MRRAAVILAAASLACVATAAAADPLAGPLAPLSFMVGDWKAVGDASGPGAGGVSSIHPDLGGRLLVRRDHVLLKDGGGFDVYQVVYADGTDLRSEFIDTEGHTIHYRVTTGPGPSAIFRSDPTGDAPGFRLTYMNAADRLHVRFEIAPPGGAFKVYSEGDVARQ